MRARLALLCMFATIGCTRDNPAFDDSTSTTGTTTEDDPTTTVEVETGESQEGQEGQEAPDPECPLEPGVALQIRLGLVGCADSPESYDRYHTVSSIDGSTLWVTTCPAAGCSADCEGASPIPLSFAPLDLTGFATIDDCLHVHARRVDPTNLDGCEFQSVVIELANDSARRPILIGRNTPGITLPIDAADPLFGFHPEPTFVDSCPCEDFPEACCDGLETTVYALDIGQPDVVHIGETAQIELPNQTYEFTTLDAFQLGECDKPPQESWGLVGK